MKFALDTNNCENIKLEITDTESEDIASAIQEFCFGMSSFFVDFLMKLGCDTEEKAKKLQEVCISCMDRNLDVMIKDVLLDDKVSSNELESDIEMLKSEMKSRGFSDKEIENIVDLVRDSGSIEAANYVLKKIGEQNGVNWGLT